MSRMSIWRHDRLYHSSTSDFPSGTKKEKTHQTVDSSPLRFAPPPLLSPVVFVVLDFAFKRSFKTCAFDAVARLSAH